MKHDSKLTGRGGVGLVIFHLARLGIEYRETHLDSGQADIWLRLPNGRMMLGEVKASFQQSWQVKRSQVAMSDVFFMVDMRMARVHLLTKEEVLQVLAASRQSGPQYTIARTQLPRSAEANWGLLFGGPDQQIYVPSLDNRQLVETGKNRTVTHKLADGSVKTYTYPVRVKAPVRHQNGQTESKINLSLISG